MNTKYFQNTDTLYIEFKPQVVHTRIAGYLRVGWRAQLVEITGLKGYESPITAWANSEVDVTRDGFKKIK